MEIDIERFSDRANQDLTNISKLIQEVPYTANRLQHYIDLEIPELAWRSLPDQSSIDSFPRVKIISIYLRLHNEKTARDWIDSLIRCYPEKISLIQFINDLRAANFTHKQILMRVLEHPNINNQEIKDLGY
jgi:hypothetical protein